MTTRTETFEIEGMSCDHCVKVVDEALAAVPGVTEHDVKIGSARVGYDDAETNRAAIERAIEEAGYTAQLA